MFIADLHADTLLWKRDPLQRGSHGHVDLPRLREGNVGLQDFGAGTGLRVTGRFMRARYQGKKLRDLIRRPRGALDPILSRNDLEELLERAEDTEALHMLREMRKKPLVFRKFDEFLNEKA